VEGVFGEIQRLKDRFEEIAQLEPLIRRSRTITVPSIGMPGSAAAIRGVLEATFDSLCCPFMIR
jgi:hypothetical protein